MSATKRSFFFSPRSFVDGLVVLGVLLSRRRFCQDEKEQLIARMTNDCARVWRAFLPQEDDKFARLLVSQLGTPPNFAEKNPATQVPTRNAFVLRNSSKVSEFVSFKQLILQNPATIFVQLSRRQLLRVAHETASFRSESEARRRRNTHSQSSHGKLARRNRG